VLANTAAVRSLVADSGVAIELRHQVPEHPVEQDDRAIKRRTRPMPGFEDFHCAANIIAGIGVMHMTLKGR
jgi:putative transposase